WTQDDYSVRIEGIYFSNNGAPIPADVAKEMFIPFFSTKPSGSGIGLSISRQMLMMQSITLSLAEHNVAGYHVTFRME
ncbi:histidine kinase, partial [Pseudomonas donghuensis]|nr:histidine kinase [Pseudomonas donghuensis]